MRKSKKKRNLVHFQIFRYIICRLRFKKMASRKFRRSVFLPLPLSFSLPCSFSFCLLGHCRRNAPETPAMARAVLVQDHIFFLPLFLYSLVMIFLLQIPNWRPAMLLKVLLVFCSYNRHTDRQAESNQWQRKVVH